MDAFSSNYVPHVVVQYTLAVVAWTCLARFLLSFFVHRDSANYIWRWFRRLTDHACAATAFITPRAVNGLFIPPIAAFWLFVLRALLFVLMLRAGLAPGITAGAPG